MRLDHLHQFLKNLFCDYRLNNLSIEIRPLYPVWREREFYPNGNPPSFWQAFTPLGIRQWFPLTTQGIAFAAKHALAVAPRYETYFGVLPRQGRGGTGKDVPFGGFLWCDVDSGDGISHECITLVLHQVRRGCIPAPNIIVGSGGGCHFYWRMVAPVALINDENRREYKALLRRLVNTIGGDSPGVHADSSRADIASVLRLPGTLNNKRQNEPRPVELLHLDIESALLSYADWMDLLPAPTVKQQHHEYPAFRADVPESYSGLLRWASEGYPEGKRHQDLTSAAAWLVRDVGVPKSIALQLLKMKAVHSIGRRTISDDELEAMIQWA